MNINYNIEIYNPISENIFPTDNVKSVGEYSVSVSNLGVKVIGSFESERKTIKACSNTFVGDTYNLSWDNSFVFENGDVSYIDIEDVFALAGKTVMSDEFNKIKNYIKKVKKQIDNKYFIDHVIEKADDVIFIGINSEGSVSILPIQLKPYTNSFTYLSDEDIFIYYFIVSKPAKIDTDEVLFIPVKDLVKIPEGFCTLSNYLTSDTGISLTNINSTEILVQTKNSVILKFSLSLNVDGYLLKEYITTPLEKLLLEITQEYEQLYNLEETAQVNNLTLIYKLKEDLSLEEVLCIADQSFLEGITITNQSELESQLDSILTADKEFKKQYVFKQYKIKILTTSDEFEILDNSVLSTFKDNILKFKNKIIKI